MTKNSLEDYVTYQALIEKKLSQKAIEWDKTTK